jgi:hypothetical protein
MSINHLVKLHRIPVDFNSASDVTLVACPAGKRIVLVGLFIKPAASVTLALYSGPSTDSVELTGNMTGADKFDLPAFVGGWGVTALNKNLVAKTSAGVQCGGVVVVEYVDDFDSDPSS